jgi:DNA-binding response OmpR family regulator
MGDQKYPLELRAEQESSMAPRRGALPCVLLIAESDLSAELVQTVLWRHEVVRVCCPDPRNGTGLAAALAPDLIVLGAIRAATTLPLVRSLRRRRCKEAAVVVVARTVSRAVRSDLESAGADAVWEHPVDPRRWDELLRDILGLTTRRELRVPLRLHVWSRQPPFEPAKTGLALDLSAHGMLLESASALEVGETLDLAFTLPPEDVPVEVCGRVVRDASSDGAARYGIEFLADGSGALDRIAAFVDSERRGSDEPPRID